MMSDSAQRELLAKAHAAGRDPFMRALVEDLERRDAVRAAVQRLADDGYEPPADDGYRVQPMISR